MNNSVSNVQIVATATEFKNANGFTVMVNGLDNKLNCQRKFTDPLKALRYMFVLQKKLNLQINRVDLAAVSLSYQRAKESLAKAQKEVEDSTKELVESVKEVNAEQDAQEKVNITHVSNEESKDLPIIEQYKKLKEKHPEALLLFRCGDFYETFFEDAQDASAILGITLTTAGGKNKYKAAGFPYHALDTYLPKLIRAGKRCAICDEISVPA